MPDRTFSGLFDDTAHLDWAPTDGVRRRARQRQRRQRFAAGAAAAAVVAVVAAGTAFALDRGPAPEPIPPASPAPSVSQSADPSASSGLGPAPGSSSAPPSGSSSSKAAPVIVTSVPASAMLAPADAGSSGWSRKDEIMGDWRVGFTFSICPTANRNPSANDIDSREAELSGPDSRYVFQGVSAYSTTAAARSYMSWVRSNVRACASFDQIRMSIVDEGFAGDESVIIHTITEDKEFFHGFVRVGNLVTEFSASEKTQARIAQLGPKAAARMCAVTKGC